MTFDKQTASRLAREAREDVCRACDGHGERTYANGDNEIPGWATCLDCHGSGVITNAAKIRAMAEQLEAACATVERLKGHIRNMGGGMTCSDENCEECFG